MDHKVTIAVIGSTGSGKSTIAEDIRDLLRLHGYVVSHDGGISGCLNPRHRPARQQAVRSCTEIKINEVQVTKHKAGTLESYADNIRFN